MPGNTLLPNCTGNVLWGRAAYEYSINMQNYGQIFTKPLTVQAKGGKVCTINKSYAAER